MIAGPIIAEIAALLGDSARATMTSALLDGRALSASELARAARITPQTASTHLAKLTEAGLLSALRSGRHRYFRLASPAVAEDHLERGRVLHRRKDIKAAVAAYDAALAVQPRDRKSVV